MSALVRRFDRKSPALITKALRWFAVALAGVLALFFGAVGLLQTRPGKDFLAAEISRLASNSRFTWTFDRLGGTVPFDMTARRITITDDKGTWLTLRDVALDIDPGSLLSGRLQIRLLHAGEWDQARPPSGRPPPLADLLRMLHLPFGMIVNRLAIDRVLLAPPVLGARVAATIVGDISFRGALRTADLDIHRIDGAPGEISLRLALTGAEPSVKLAANVDDPTGIIDDRILDRTDNLPLVLTIRGSGPVSRWHGRLTAAVGRKASLAADLALVMGRETALGLTGHAGVAALLPADLAPMIGNDAKLSLHATFGEPIVLDRLSLATAAGTIAGNGAFDGPTGAVAAHLDADLPDLSKLAPIMGVSLRGSAVITAALSGTRSRPTLKTDIAATKIGAFDAAIRSVSAEISLAATGSPGSTQTRFEIDAKGQLAGVALPKGGALAARLGEKIAWSLAATIDRDEHALDLTHLGVTTEGLGIDGSGRLDIAAGGVTGAITLGGSASGMRTGFAPADILLGPAPSFAAELSRDNAGVLTLDHLVLTGVAAKLAGSARFDPLSNEVNAALSIELPRLAALRPAIGGEISGSLAARAIAQGPLSRLQLATQFDGRGIGLGGPRIDQLRVTSTVADLSTPIAAITGSFRTGHLDGRLAVVARPVGDTGLALSHLRVTAADSTIAGDLGIAFASRLVQGSLTARFPDLSRWSGFAGKPLGGSLDLTAGLTAARNGQDLDVMIGGARLALGAGASTIAIGRLAANARLADLWRDPTGTGRLVLRAVHSGHLEFSNATATFASRDPGRFAFDGSAAGQPLSLAFGGEAGLMTGGADLRLARLAGALGNQRFALEQPLDLRRRGSDVTLSRLALRFGSGRLAGTGSLNGETLVVTADGSDLPIGGIARLAGYPNVHGELSGAVTLGGSVRAPRGRFTIRAERLALAVSRQTQVPHLGLTVDGDWNGRAVDMRGQVTGLHGDRIALTGAFPLVLSEAPWAISLPSQGRLAVNLQGGGDIGHLADLLPLGEDRLSGRFAVDASIGGTVAAPIASGQLKLSGARYENFASGAVLSDLDAELVGNGDSFRLASLAAGDGAGGSLTAQGGFVLGGAAGPTAELSAKLAKFRIAARDELVATASGTISVTGPLAAPKVTAPLTIDRAEINLPTSLPPNVVVLKVTESSGRTPVAAAQHPGSAPAFPAQLDITLGLSGPVRVQGRGLDSQWSGRLKISGTSAAPKITGTLTANRGSYTLLGTSFRLTRGTITFDGGARTDPALDIIAEASAADITAQVVITGLASAPKVSLSSTPLLPQDEILARVLFGSNVRQMTAGQGLELAQAAAALSGKDPGVLDRLRGGLRLDWLRFGQGPAGAASSILNPSIVTPTSQNTTAVSAGKYIAPGVSVGVTQGVSPPTSKVTVEVDLGHHLTVDTEAGQNNGTGIGLSYNYDY